MNGTFFAIRRLKDVKRSFFYLEKAQTSKNCQKRIPVMSVYHCTSNWISFSDEYFQVLHFRNTCSTFSTVSVLFSDSTHLTSKMILILTHNTTPVSSCSLLRQLRRVNNS